MIGEEDENGVESIIIDEKKEKSPYQLRRSDGITHPIFPDHKRALCVNHSPAWACTPTS